jgi:hypothetical protein
MSVIIPLVFPVPPLSDFLVMTPTLQGDNFRLTTLPSSGMRAIGPMMKVCEFCSVTYGDVSGRC